MDFDAPSDSATILFVFLSQYAFGRFLGIRPWIRATLVGLCLIAVPVAMLANVYAAAIRPLVMVISVVGAGSSLWFFYREYQNASFATEALRRVLWIVVFGTALFALNRPTNVLFRHGEPTKLLFHDNYSYFASQSTEMLNAHYGSRLRISNAYPKEWGRYHFFNASTKAILQAWVRHPALFSYEKSLTAIVVFILLFAVEAFLLAFGTAPKTLLFSVAWIVIGFTLFQEINYWSLATTGTISAFATLWMLFAFFEEKGGELALAVTFFGISVPRNLPIAFVAGLLLLWLHRRKYQGRLMALRSRLRPGHVTLGLLCLGYIGLTVHAPATVEEVAKGTSLFATVNGSFNPKTLIRAAISDFYWDDGWHSSFSIYKVYGAIGDFIGKELFPMYRYDPAGIFRFTAPHNSAGAVFLALLSR